MIARRALAGLAAALTLAGCGDGLDRAGAPDTIRFSILNTENSQTSQQYWAPVLADMEKATGLQVKPYFQSNYTGLIEAMRFKQTDVGWFSNQSGLEAVRRAGGEVFARTTDPSGVDGYYSVLIVPARSNLTLDDVLKCDKSLTFGIGDAKSTSGTLAPMTYLFAPRNIDPKQCFKTVRSANHQANLFAVARGVLDVATNNTTGMRLNLERGEEEARQVKIIWRSPVLPEDPIVYRKDLDPAVKEKLRQFFLTYGREGPDAERQRANLVALSIGGFLPADDTHLLPVREMEATETLLRARADGDPGEIEKAERDLAAIRQQRIDAAGKAGQPLMPVP
ncbi:MAG TPA: phosphate/phosphite/phosphonate ABC transporter substrate-binding protein [Caulobacteraceae bacterium]|nr:phosphate/phosphite/phosphonate ABC transporter substrate-binding protein [Caulobacteraceae bacterium]